MRYRQKRIALLADIEAMFYQVRVADVDCIFLRFLWWPDGDLESELEELCICSEQPHPLRVPISLCARQQKTAVNTSQKQ